MALFKAFRGSRASLDAVEKHDGYAYFCTDDGSFHIDFVDADGNLQRKQISAGEAEKLTGYSISTSLLYGSDTQIPTTRAVKNSLNSLQRKIVHADLATNDSSKRSYVKNRTHWIEYEKGEELVSFSFNAETSYVNGYRALSYDEEAEAAIALLKTLLVEGTMHIVVHNNIEYECVVSHGFMSDEIYLGNMWLSSSAKEDTEEQFLIRPNENGYGHFVSIGAGVQSIAIYAANEIVHPLDEKFLPDVAVTQDDISGFAPIDSPEFLNSISLGRNEDSTVGPKSVALGANVEASGYNAFASGSGTVASGAFSFAEGNGSVASQYCAHAENCSEANGAMSHAENNATANGTSSHAEGESTTQGSYAHAEGYQTQAIGSITHTEGWQTEAYGGNSHAEGSLTVTHGGNSHAEGYGTITQGMAQHVQGKYNAKETFYENRIVETGTFGFATYYSSDGYTFDELTGKFTLTDATTVSYPEYSTTKYFSQGVNPTITIFKFTEITSEESVNEKTGTYERITSYMENDYAHVLGNGTDDENRSNAHTVDWNGLGWFAGGLKIGGTGQDDENAKNIATETYVDEKIAEIPIPDVSGQIAVPKNSIAFIDQVNGYTYIACMRDGNFVTYCGAKSIEVATMPIKTEYMAGEYFDPTGMIVTALTYDGTTREIADFTYPSTYITEGDTSIEITYIEAGITHTATVPVTVSAFDPAIVLVDFEYTANDDGTYTVTGWKDTLNGEASTEMIIPNNGLIIV